MRHHFAMAITGLLAACAPAPPPAGTQFDGSYVGQNTLVSGGVNFICGAPNYSARLIVHDGRFDYPFSVNGPRYAPVPVQVAADGSFLGQMQYGPAYNEGLLFQQPRTAWVTVRGRIIDTTLDATIADDRCVRRVMAERH
jgi:hypothetical protein